MKELALGLEKIKVKFLLVLREADKGNVFDGKVRQLELPKGIEERVEGIGMVEKDWVPQPQILAHPSTSGFMSHCGWNSCMESISMGVPIAEWPIHSDQPSNTVLITDILKMGLVVRDWKQRMELVRALSVVSVVRRLMASEEGYEIW
ncbi:zeatin o-glucosyltransferase [Phtheirospermum japonicum]|uniref:Zeatin o-glucosyltransferase n=1 Tax=Phtheirospermum japonicum TaxID=374723 RepID=A0A830BCM7_9LAMI|nr:zeatin o-glucosyltransferase [Phtheirospermum japonicum]